MAKQSELSAVYDTPYFYQSRASFECRKGWTCDKCPRTIQRLCDVRQDVALRWRRATAAGVEDELD